MGTKNSPNDEWIELYNNSLSPIDMSGWKIISNDKTPNIVLKNKIPSKGFFILERTDNTTLPNIKADLIYKGSLNNNGEYLRLVDVSGRIIDEIDCSKKWFFGDNEAKKTMERKNTLVNGNNLANWQTSENSGGTPKNENSKGQKINNNDQKEKKSTMASLLMEKDNKVQKTKDPSLFFSFLIAMSIAISSGAFVLFLKNKIDREC